MENYFKKAAANIGELGNGKAIVQLFVQPTIGAAIYTAVPSALQGWGNIDMTGWKMPIVGTLASVGAGIIAGSPGIVAGGFGAFLAHLAYTKFQSAYKAIFKTYIPRFDPNLVATFADGNDGNAGYIAPPAQQQLSLDGGDNIVLYGQPKVYEATATPNTTRAAVRIMPAPRVQQAAPQLQTAAPAMNDNGNATALLDNHTTLYDNNATSLNDNNAYAFNDEFDSLMDSATKTSYGGNASSLNPAFFGDAGGSYF